MASCHKIGPEHRAQWQEFVDSHAEATPYHDFGWGQAIEETYDHRAHYFVAKEGSEILAILPVIEMTRPLLNAQFCSLPFCDVGGCLSSSSAIEVQLTEYAHSLISTDGKSPLELRQSVRPAAQPAVAEILNGQKVRMLLSLPDSSEELFSSFKSKLRSQVRKSEKNGLTYEIGRSTSLIDEFYEVFSHNMRALGSPVHSKKLFEQLLNVYDDRLVISIVRTNGLPIAGGIVLLGKHTASIPWASTRAEFNQLAPNMMLYWSLLKHVTETGIQVFDFGRSSFGEGTFKFKQQWGAKPVELIWSSFPNAKTYRPAKASGLIDIKKVFVNVWQNLPLKLTKILGPLIRKHINL